MTIATESRSDLHREVEDFLFLEAEYLDDNRLRDWHALFDAEIVYQMPIRVTRERSAGPGFVADAFHMKEDWYSLQTRIARLETEYAWAEDPPSRMRRFVTNVRVRPGERDDEIGVKSNILIYRSRGDTPDYFVFAAERQDTLRRVDDGLRIVRRVVLVDHTTLGMPNLGIFF
jgi:3-phenylpropionate/cinnamic acid dioxygenase small subunit